MRQAVTMKVGEVRRRGGVIARVKEREKETRRGGGGSAVTAVLAVDQAIPSLRIP